MFKLVTGKAKCGSNHSKHGIPLMCLPSWRAPHRAHDSESVSALHADLDMHHVTRQLSHLCKEAAAQQKHVCILLDSVTVSWGVCTADVVRGRLSLCCSGRAEL